MPLPFAQLFIGFGIRNCPQRSGHSQAADHQATHRGIDHRFTGSASPFLVFTPAPAVPEPGKRAFHDPAARSDGDGRGAGSPSAQTTSRREGGRTGAGLHPQTWALQAGPCPAPWSPASRQTWDRPGPGAVVSAGERCKAPPWRALTSAACPGQGRPPPGVSTRRGRGRPWLVVAPAAPRSPPPPVVFTLCASLLPARGGASLPRVTRRGVRQAAGRGAPSPLGLQRRPSGGPGVPGGKSGGHHRPGQPVRLREKSAVRIARPGAVRGRAGLAGPGRQGVQPGQALAVRARGDLSACHSCKSTPRLPVRTVSQTATHRACPGRPRWPD